jgi:SAM-dependent methyltransferase
MAEDTAAWYYDRVTEMEVAESYRYVMPFLEGGAKRVLDLGCGVGYYLKRFSQASVGVDASLPSVDICNERGLNARFGDLNKPLEFGPNEFDVVFCSHILEHVDSPLNLLRESHRVLKKDGLIIVAVPNEASLPNALALDKYWQSHPEHTYSFSVTNLKILLLKAHFEPLEIYVNPYLIGKILSLIRFKQNFIMSLIQRLPTRITLQISSAYMMLAQKT